MFNVYENSDIYYNDFSVISFLIIASLISVEFYVSKEGTMRGIDMKRVPGCFVGNRMVLSWKLAWF